ncbi:MAG: TIGR04165 family Cys-rich peptide [Methanobacteriaceae archaeon]|jgi:Cys-rich peptide (TIGR04165 family)|nr:TIGR04165 family Cys-rich peptide [Methanobacteriaceae archaeon]MDZ4171501.1 TIGR04165 family Cys-rich peptide [Methanobacteriaceae archaeon]
MKCENLNQECPKCGSMDKRISHKRNVDSGGDAFYIPHIPQGSVGVIKCNECGHLFEVCADSEMPVEVKKKLV